MAMTIGVPRRPVRKSVTARLRISGGKRFLLVMPKKRTRELESIARIPPKNIMVSRTNSTVAFA